MAEPFKEALSAAWAKFFRSLPGYPWLPCPICKGVEGCDHIVGERARAAGHNLHSVVSSTPN